MTASNGKSGRRVAFAAAAFLPPMLSLLCSTCRRAIALVETAAPYFTILALGALGRCSFHAASYYYRRPSRPPNTRLRQSDAGRGRHRSLRSLSRDPSWLIGVCGGLFAGVALTGYFWGQSCERAEHSRFPACLGAFSRSRPTPCDNRLACASRLVASRATSRSTRSPAY